MQGDAVNRPLVPSCPKESSQDSARMDADDQAWQQCAQQLMVVLDMMRGSVNVLEALKYVGDTSQPKTLVGRAMRLAKTAHARLIRFVVCCLFSNRFVFVNMMIVFQICSRDSKLTR